MGAVRRSECVVAVDVAVGSEFLCEFFLLFLEFSFSCLEIFVGFAVFLLRFRLFFFVVTGVFEHDDVTGLHRGDFSIGFAAVRNECHGFAEKLGEVFGNGLEAGIGCDALFIGSAEVAHENEAAALFKNVFDGGESALDPGVVLDDAFFEGHVEVNAHDDAFSLQINIAQCFFIHDESLFCYRISVQEKRADG